MKCANIIGMVFKDQIHLRNPSMYNITLLMNAGVKDKQFLDDIVETSLKQAALGNR